MDLRKSVSWLALFVGVVFLAIGAATAQAEDDYKNEAFQCDLNCQFNFAPYKDAAECKAAKCSKYYDVNCVVCVGCGAGGEETKCKKSPADPCGDDNPTFCKNGLCICYVSTLPLANGNTYYVCFCKRP